jgi:hypothetical protein
MSVNYLLPLYDDDDDDDFAIQMLMDDDDDEDPIVFEFMRLRYQLPDRQPRRRPKHYLTRPELLPSPRVCSGWQSIYHSREDRAYIHIMGIDVATFDYILTSGFREAWESQPIKRTDTNPSGASRKGARSLDATGGLGLALHFLCSTMSESSLQIIFALTPSTVSRYINFALDLLLAALEKLPEGRLEWPEEDVMKENSRLINAKHSTAKYLDGAFGFMDGLNLPVTTNCLFAVQDPNYNGWLHSHVVSNIMVFSPDGKCLVCLNSS